MKHIKRVTDIAKIGENVVKQAIKPNVRTFSPLWHAYKEPKFLDTTNSQGKVISQDSIPQAVKGESVQAFSESASSDPGLKKTIEYAREKMFGNKTSRAFSASSVNLSEVKRPEDGKDREPNSISADHWQPESLADLRPSKEVADQHNELKKETWRRYKPTIIALCPGMRR